jgi:hypothetical protein
VQLADLRFGGLCRVTHRPMFGYGCLRFSYAIC